MTLKNVTLEQQNTSEELTRRFYRTIAKTLIKYVLNRNCCLLELLQLRIYKTDKYSISLLSICDAAADQKKYTPHCLRSTAITCITDS